MLLAARRRRRRTAYSNYAVAEPKPRILIRLIIGAVIFGALWFVGSRVFAFIFDGGSERASVLLEQASGSVDVSLQGGENLRAEKGLKLYEGDTITTRTSGHAVLEFFDGTRMRVDEDTEVLIEESDRAAEGISSILLNVPTGRLWVSVANDFTGEITRTVTLPTLSVTLPENTSGLISAKNIFFVQTSGVGATVRLNLPGAEGANVTVGEGQKLLLSDDAIEEIASGTDPYAFRDPVTDEDLAIAFVRESRQSLGDGESTAASSASGRTTNDVLTVTSPANDARISTETVTVSGSVDGDASSVYVNGREISLQEDGNFSEELDLPDGDTVTFTIQARNERGVTLAEITRTLTRGEETATGATVGAPTITGPVKNGETYTTEKTELRIEGTVPDGTAGVMVNDYKLQLFKAGDKNWAYIASVELGNIKVGSNTFDVRAINAAGTQSAASTITVIVEGDESSSASSSSSVSSLPQNNNAPLKPGSVTVNAPTAGVSHTTTEEEILIEGSTSAETAAVYVNGYQLQLYEAGKTFWNYIASTEFGTLKPGKNTYTIITRDKDGNVLDSIEYEITYNNEE